PFIYPFISPLRPPPHPTLFPYTTLFRSRPVQRPPRGPAFRERAPRLDGRRGALDRPLRVEAPRRGRAAHPQMGLALLGARLRPGDRKSTRLNSSHVAISYAVFCMKKKKK